MTNLEKKLLLRSLLGVPIGWFGLSLSATCITWWRGASIFFAYAMILGVVLLTPLAYIKIKNYFLLTCFMSINAILFSAFGLCVLFFPQLIGDPNVYFVTSPGLSYVILGISLALFLFFLIKKITEIDYNKMREYALKNKTFLPETATVYLNNYNFAIAPMKLAVKFFKTPEKILFIVGLGIVALVAIPGLSLSSMLQRDGNSLISATFFFVMTYFLIFWCIWGILSTYSQYRFIQKLETECGKKLKFALKSID